jgi:alkaline phosphatase
MALLVSLPVLFFFQYCSVKTYEQTPLPEGPPKAAKPKNIILMIGDGMALAQISAGMYWKGNGRSAFELFPVVGFHTSHSSNNLITDSAAGATAFACGHKTYNGAIGVLPPDDTPCENVMHQLGVDSLATGIVVTCSATHATPAAFIAHQEIRAFSEAIAMEYLDSPLDCYIGGGEYYFNNRPDKKPLEDSLLQEGYVIRRNSNLNKLPMDGSAPFMVFTAPREPAPALKGRDYLPKATSVACEYLRNRSDKGFFLMVEGSQIDWALHANDPNWLRTEMLDFERAVRAALEFAAADGNTLVLVTGDHECGGLSLEYGGRSAEFTPSFAERLHTAAMVPVLAYGPQDTLFTGIYDNTELYYKMMQALGR